MTLLTIGYGNIVPNTFGGRVFMIFYTTIGLCVAGFFIIAVEDVIIQDIDLPALVIRFSKCFNFFFLEKK